MRIVNVSSKMHELAGGVDVDDPHFEARGAFSSLAAYNCSKLCQARPGAGRAGSGGCWYHCEHVCECARRVASL